MKIANFGNKEHYVVVCFYLFRFFSFILSKIFRVRFLLFFKIPFIFEVFVTFVPLMHGPMHIFLLVNQYGKLNFSAHFHFVIFMMHKINM